MTYVFCIKILTKLFLFNFIALKNVSDIGAGGVFHGLFIVFLLLHCVLDDLTCKVLKVELYSEFDSIDFSLALTSLCTVTVIGTRISAQKYNFLMFISI